MRTAKLEREPDEIVLGWLHLLYHVERPKLYSPSRSAQVCRYCREFAGG